MSDVSLVSLHNHTGTMMEQSRRERDGSPDSFCSDKWTPHHQRTYSDVQKKRNQEIVRQLLQEFDMDATITHYRLKDSQEFVLDENDFSVDASLSTMRIRQNLQRLMGTDVIRLNDRNYTETLLRRLKEDYEANMDKKEKALEDAEKQRLRKLMLEGIITVSMMENPDGKYQRSNKKKHKRKGKTHTKKKAGHWSIMHEDSPYYQESSERSELSPHSDNKTQMELIDNTDDEDTQKNEGNHTDGEEEVSADNSAENSPREMGVKKQVQWSKPKTEVYYRNGSAAKSAPLNYLNGKFSKTEPPLLREFREEESVDGLYRLAERLVL